MQEANPKPDLKRPTGSSTSIVCTGLPYLGWTYQDLIACLLVERLWQLEQHKPYMLAHVLPQGCSAQQLVQALPARVQGVLTHKQQQQQEDEDWTGFAVDDDADADSPLSTDDDLVLVPLNQRVMESVAANNRACSISMERLSSMLMSAGSLRTKSFVVKSQPFTSTKACISAWTC